MFGFVSGSTYWIVLAIYDPNNTPISTAWMVGCFVYVVHASIYACTFLVTNILTTAVFSIFLINHVKNATLLSTLSPIAVSFPLSLGIAEVIRSCGFWAMPWGMIGYTQVDNPLLSGLYPIAGIYGATVAITALSVSFVYWGRLTLRFWRNDKPRNWRDFFSASVDEN